jgi:molybdopterin-guanine dinucleotide biosynthesis protein A
MGRDKALVEVDGRPMAATVALALMAAGALEVVTVGGDVEGLAAAGLAVVEDRYPGEGPLGGMVTALGHFALLEVPVVVLACDLPAVSAMNVSATVSAISVSPEGAPVVAVPLVAGRRQWMHACWTPEAGVLMSAAFSAGERAAWRAAEASMAAGLRIVEVVGPSSAGFRDADQPGDLEAGDR